MMEASKELAGFWVILYRPRLRGSDQLKVEMFLIHLVARKATNFGGIQFYGSQMMHFKLSSQSLNDVLKNFVQEKVVIDKIKSLLFCVLGSGKTIPVELSRKCAASNDQGINWGGQ